MNNRKYTKGDCYALCEFLECLCRDCGYVIADVADALGYESNRMTELLQKLGNDVNDTICDEQDERDDTDQMADIMQIVHISGHPDDWTMRDKHWNHDIKADDTAADLALVIDDIYANTSNDVQAVDAILDLCKKILKKGA